MLLRFTDRETIAGKIQNHITSGDYGEEGGYYVLTAPATKRTLISEWNNSTCLPYSNTREVVPA
jgi:hypothetical protein